MQNLKRAARIGILYISAFVLIVSPSMAVHAAEDETYYYDEATGQWNSSKWVYNPVTKVYEPAPVAKPSPSPTPSTTPAPEQSTDDEGDSSEDTSAADTTTGGSGPSSNNSVDQDTDIDSTTNINSNKEVNNDLDSNATSGNAGVKQNTKGGDAKTGNASGDATIVNSVHSTVGNDKKSGVAHFTIDLYGDVNGDIVIGPDATKNATKTTDINSKTNVNNNDTITNNVDLTATSGDAAVSGNTVAGSAQSGDANAVVNLLNLVNTVIAANESFVGTINIHGNLNGDILMSPEFIPQLLASNADNVTEMEFNMPLSTNINDDQTIVNNIDLSATSGTASVKDNTSAGSAKTGSAQTKLQVLNLTGREVDAESGLLIFVNVKGTWVGLLMDAPGATAAAYGSGVTKNSTTLSDTVNVNNQTAITNNINVAAVSGDASVESNTSGGDATTGDAYASANVANISNSKFNFKKRLTILYINIFGDWKGLALQNSEAGDVIETVTEVASSTPVQTASVGAPNVKLGFVPRASSPVNQAVSVASQSGGDSYPAAVLASAINNEGGQVLGQTLKPTLSPREDPFSTILMIGGFGVAGISAIIWSARRLLEMRASRIV